MEELYGKVQAYLDAQELLKFNNVDNIEGHSTISFVKNVLDANRKTHTVLVNSNILQTTTGRRRSIGDLYRICKYYRPDITVKELHDALLDLVAVEKVATLICPDIQKRVWRYEPNRDNGDFICYPSDEFGLDYDLSNINSANKSWISGPGNDKEKLNMIEL